jgi:hypothetical protein
MAILKSNKRKTLRVVGVREAARLTNMSPAHVWYIRHGDRKSARFERKMRELGLIFTARVSTPSEEFDRRRKIFKLASKGEITFEPAAIREALKRQGKGGK